MMALVVRLIAGCWLAQGKATGAGEGLWAAEA